MQAGTPVLIWNVACLFALAPVARAQDVDIGVRSKVMDKDNQWSHKSGTLHEEGGHSKTFAIVAIEEVKAASRLVRPVDQQNSLEQLYEQLLVNGFTKYAKGTKPDILLAVSYGRGEMRNPYFKNHQGEVGGNGFRLRRGSGDVHSGAEVTTVTLSGHD